MAISFYEKGQLSSGFYGWRVVATIRGKLYQKYFSLHRPTSDIPYQLWYKYQKTRARYFEARWMARSAATQYLDFINKNHPNTKPNRGVGFQGITIGIGPSAEEIRPICYFSVNKKGKARRFYIDNNTTISGAWRDAVTYWGNIYEIRPKDISIKLGRTPSPDIFKALRKHMNSSEGHNLPPSVLHYVYSEKRLQIKSLKSQKYNQEHKISDDLLSVKSHLENEIEKFQKKSE
ncbi:hypothetical protein MD273_17290 [Marinobacter pelagius]|uniref:hypothetical protein n=1 Tax=Marinobacter sp. C7 TaxID=2951363 RepID=UPI001EF0C2A9|nr:hypothetical protein [Marinobacter sp. C7]MCG7201495.1 hypothetical protein [Marinobacter sp. C7]